MLKTQSAMKRNKSNSDEEFLDACDIMDEGFIDGDVNLGKVLSTFSFGMSTDSGISKASSTQVTVQSNGNGIFNTQNQPFTAVPRGLTPPINGESFTIKRSYAMRQSTVRKLNALKAEHPDVNVLFNTLVDLAISHYYNYIFNNHGSFHPQEEKKVTS